jgi:predicted PurR-regulated permease PerM
VTRRGQIAAFWLIGLAVFVGLLFVLRSILLPFVAGMALAYILDPVADRLERLGLSRMAAAVLILMTFLVFFGAILLVLVPVLIIQLADLIVDLPAYVGKIRGLLSQFLDSRIADFFGLDSDTISNKVSDFLSSGANLLSGVASSIWSGGLALVNVVSLTVVTPFVAFYLLRDWEKLVARIDGLLPLDHADDIRRLANEIDRKVAAFVRGQLLVGLLLGIFYATGLVVIGLNFGLLIGLGAGILSFIPFLGFAVGFVLSIILAVAQFWPDWIWLVATVAVFMVGQMLEGYVLQPRLLGKRLGLHPVWIFFSLFAFGLLLGFIGLLIAIPAAAAIGVLLNYGTERYRASEIYLGHKSKKTG